MDGTILSTDVEIYFRSEGSGDPVLLLHGAPDSGDLWRHQVVDLQAAGYQTTVPDLRGFGRSSRPAEVEKYELRHSVGDVVRLLDHLEVRRTHVVAHDWGGQVAWLMASLLPRRVDHLVTIASPHPFELWDPPIEQRRRSWYVLLAHHEEAEELLTRSDWRLMRELTGFPRDIDAHIAGLRRPGALRAMLNWYRANAGPAFERAPLPRLPKVAAPTLALSGQLDHALTEEVIRTSGAHVTGPWEYRSVAGATHWIPVDAAEELSKILIEFLGSHDTSRTRSAAGRRRRS